MYYFRSYDWLFSLLLFNKKASFLSMFYLLLTLVLSIVTDWSYLLLVNNLSFKDIYKYDNFFVDWVPTGAVGLRFGFGYNDCRVKYWLFVEFCCCCDCSCECCSCNCTCFLPSVKIWSWLCLFLVLLQWIYCFNFKFYFSLLEIWSFISLIFL